MSDVPKLGGMNMITKIVKARLVDHITSNPLPVSKESKKMQPVRAISGVKPKPEPKPKTKLDTSFT